MSRKTPNVGPIPGYNRPTRPGTGRRRYYYFLPLPPSPSVTLPDASATRASASLYPAWIARLYASRHLTARSARDAAPSASDPSPPRVHSVGAPDASSPLR